MTDPTPPVAPSAPYLDLQLLDPDDQFGGKDGTPVDRFKDLSTSAEIGAALLALILPIRSERALRAWHTECAATPGAELLLEHAQQLPGADRLPWFDTLLTRLRAQPLADRQALVAATRRVFAARGSVRPIDRLHWLVMRRRLGETAPAAALAPGARDLTQLPDKDVASIAIFSAFLSRLIPVEPHDGSPAAFEPGFAWYAAVMAPWSQRWAIPPCEAPTSDALNLALQELQVLPWMQRPSLVRGWVTAAIDASPEGKLNRSAADALRLTCVLLDSPLPPEVARHFSADPEERPR